MSNSNETTSIERVNHRWEDKKTKNQPKGNWSRDNNSGNSISIPIAPRFSILSHPIIKTVLNNQFHFTAVLRCVKKIRNFLWHFSLVGYSKSPTFSLKFYLSCARAFRAQNWARKSNQIITHKNHRNEKRDMEKISPFIISRLVNFRLTSRFSHRVKCLNNFFSIFHSHAPNPSTYIRVHRGCGRCLAALMRREFKNYFIVRNKTFLWVWTQSHSHRTKQRKWGDHVNVPKIDDENIWNSDIHL